MKISNLPKMAAEEAVWIIAEIIVIFAALRVNEVSGPGPAILAFIGGSWLFYNLSSYTRIWNTISMLQDPARAFFLYTSGALVYFSLISYPLQELVLVSLAAGLIGSALAILFTTYWNIGG